MAVGAATAGPLLEAMATAEEAGVAVTTVAAGEAAVRGTGDPTGGLVAGG
jgi:hypothetical protein